MTRPPSDRPADSPYPFALENIACEVEGLEALIVLHLGDAHVHAAFLHEGAGFSPIDIAVSLRDAYRANQSATRRLTIFAAPSSLPSGKPSVRDRITDLPDPIVTLEAEGRCVVMSRVRAFVIVCLFDPIIPLGMARFLAARLANTLSPDLPVGDENQSETTDEMDEPSKKARLLPPPPLDPPTRRFPSAKPVRGETDRARRLLALLDTRAREPHIARYRLALRTGLTPDALDRPEMLGNEATAMMETAIGEILGLDAAELKRLV